MTAVDVHFVLPDLSVPSGGNLYDQRVATGLAALPGWRVVQTELPGAWPHVRSPAYARLAQVLGEVPDDGVVVVDGLVACAAPDVVELAAERVPVVVLVHLPLPDETGLPAQVAGELAEREARTLRAAAAVVVTSPWAARRLARYDLRAGSVHIAGPGTEPATLARGSLSSGGTPELLCVAALTQRKDQLTLVEALAQVADLAWTCTCVGPAEKSTGYAAAVHARIDALGLAGRIRLAGARTGAALEASYAAADLFVLISRVETFGMVIAEALSRGLPVVTAAGGAAEETLGADPDGAVPGLLVPPGDPVALAAALRSWLTDEALRSRLKRTAARRRHSLSTWDETVQAMATVVQSVRAAASVRS